MIAGYAFSAATGEPPSADQIRLDSTTIAGLTKAWVRYVSADGIDLFYPWTRLVVGTALYIQDKNDHTQVVAVRTTGPAIDKGAYAELPIAPLPQAATDVGLSGGQAVLVMTLEPAAEGPEPSPGTPPQLLSLAEAKRQLNLTSADFDDTVLMKMSEASAVIVSYLKTAGDPTWVPATTPADVKAAAALYLGYLYDHRGDEGTDQDADVWAAIFNMLARRRTPALA